jgi:YebC/PmpR family DNA-binding regulatory protein
MAGHSKWANIQHRKGKQDARRAKIFTKLIREINVASRMQDAARLRIAVDKALANNMSRDTIDRAIKRGAGEGGADQVEELRYEGYGPCGVAILVDTMTDNKNRTAGEVRHAFTKAGCSLGVSGSVAYLFKQQGMISFAPGSDENKIMEVALDAGADDIQSYDDGSIDVITNLENFIKVKDGLDAAGLPAANAELSMEASLKVDINDKEEAIKIMALIEKLEDLDDVQTVYSNANINSEILSEL